MLPRSWRFLSVYISIIVLVMGRIVLHLIDLYSSVHIYTVLLHICRQYIIFKNLQRLSIGTTQLHLQSIMNQVGQCMLLLYWIKIASTASVHNTSNAIQCALYRCLQFGCRTDYHCRALLIFQSSFCGGQVYFPRGWCSDHKTRCNITLPSAKPFIWKLVLFMCK